MGSIKIVYFALNMLQIPVILLLLMCRMHYGKVREMQQKFVQNKKQHTNLYEMNIKGMMNLWDDYANNIQKTR